MKILLAATGLLLSLASCSVSVPGIKSVNANEFEKLLQTGNIQLLDVRTAEEFAQGHIPGATNIDVQQPDSRANASWASIAVRANAVCAVLKS